LRIASIEDGLEQAFWKHVDKDPLDYYFFILDWKSRRDQTKIWVATEDEQIHGLMLVYRDYVVQLRGNHEAVGLLLDHLPDLKESEFNVPLECEGIMTAKFVPQLRQEMMLMSLKKGEENIQITTAPVKLGPEDADEISALMREADPDWWGEMSGDRLKGAMTPDAYWLGIRQNEQIVSVGQTRFVDFGSNVGVAATRKDYRNRGYATSIVSALVKEILEFSPTALIHVIRDNAPAIRAYSKVGFKPYKTYLSFRACRQRS